MKKSTVFILLFVLILPIISFSANPNIQFNKINNNKIKTPVFEGLTANDIINFNKNEIEEKLGRKLTFQERLSLKFVKRKLQENNNFSPQEAYNEVKYDGLAIAGFIFGLIGIGLIRFLPVAFLIIMFGLIAIILSSIALVRIKKSNTKRKGKILAALGLSFGIIITLLVALVTAIMFLAY